ncbi:MULTISPECIES: hypothetical protein [unclassified Carboxylicivirga]|uniref:hypothetical protein n=1 Tax=Carboxylicivirga TaxID=1628153 RepID=UPI003D343BBF
MNLLKQHSFHIPVLGLGYTLDTPINVAPYGISSVISLVDDKLMEQMREFYCNKFDLPFKAISDKVEDFRAKRITLYLNMVDDLVSAKVAELKKSAFEKGSELEKYFNMLPDFSAVKEKFNLGEKSRQLKSELSTWIQEHLPVGDIDVNIMTKLDKVNYKDGEQLPIEFNDAHAAVRGFAQSKLSSSLVLSAGMSPRLFSYLERFKDFFPDADGTLKKKIILKVSDFRSALVQGKMLAAKGLWVSEYRIESGVNCGGHAFPTNGVLFGPILDEFRNNRDKLIETCKSAYEAALGKKNLPVPAETPVMKVTAQGGVGTNEEHRLLMDHYRMDGVGWGTPFLLVPEAISIDQKTLDLLKKAKEKDLYFSGLSPLGVPFNSVKWASMSEQRLANAAKGQHGMPCTKQYLKYNTEYTDKPICTASKQYQSKKLAELEAQNLPEADYKRAYDAIIEKECLCVGLGVSLLESKGIQIGTSDKVTVCPGPNLAYFSNEMSLKDMVDHIYGRKNVLDDRPRPHMFIKELGMYLDIFKNRLENYLRQPDDAKEQKQLKAFQKNIMDGVAYYTSLFKDKKQDVLAQLEELLNSYPVIKHDM